MKKIIIRIHYALAFTVLLYIGSLYAQLLIEDSDKIGYQVQCTPIPSLYENWRRTVIEKDMEKQVENIREREFMEYVQQKRESRVKTLKTRFLDIARMTPEQRKTEGERVLWENEKIMVLVDTYSQAPKVLVVAKMEDVWLIEDADEQLRKDMAIIAAAASDALMEATKRICKPENISKIEIHTIKQLDIQQLHIHVDPTWNLSSGDSEEAFYDGVQKRLIEKLGKRKRQGSKLE